METNIKFPPFTIPNPLKKRKEELEFKKEIKLKKEINTRKRIDKIFKQMKNK